MFTTPMKSKSHKLLEILSKRLALSTGQRKSLDRMSSGLKGEQYLYKRFQSELQCAPIKLFNLHLKVNSSECQIDCLLIFQTECILIEVKNYQGDFFIQDNDWYMLSKESIKNPLHQLQRSELLLNQFLKKHQIPLKVTSFIIFTHPEFHLYQAPLNTSIIFPAQLRRFIQRLQNIPCHLQKQHHDIAGLLQSKHIYSSPYESKISYNYTDLRKGVTCIECDGFMKLSDYNHMCCFDCKFMDKLDAAIMRSTFDYNTLFPDKKITVQAVSEWTGHPISKLRIKNILLKHCQYVKMGKYSHYLLKQVKEHNP